MDMLLRERSTVLGSSLVEQPVGRRAFDLGDDGVWERHPRSENPSLDQLDVPVQKEALSDARIADRLRAYADYASGTAPDPDGAEPAAAIPITIRDAFRTAQQTGREFLRNQEDYLLAAIRLLQERHLWGPRFFNTTSVGLSGEGDGGRFEHATRILNSLRATQRLPYGGAVEAQWIVEATNQLRDRATGSYMQSSRLVLGADIPLLRGAGRVAREDLVQAERDLVYQARSFERSRRELLVSIAEDYFALLEQASVIRNQLEQIRGLERLLESTTAKVEAGRLRPFQQDLAENQLLRAQATLANLRERYILQQDRFKIRLGLEVENPLDLGEFELTIPSPAVSQADAVDRALQFRLDLQNRRDQLDDRRRAVRNAKNALLPSLDLSGQIGIPTPDDDSTGGLAIDPEELDYAVEMSLGLPLDREIERLSLRSRIIDLERAIRDYEQFRDNLIVEARSTVRGIDLARFQLRLAEEQVRINERRLEDLSLRDDTDPQSIVDAERELNEARNARDSAMTDLRTTILNYLLTTDQLRVDESGLFQPLPGWETAPAGAG
jgi:outer membrane protein TolC